jgi:hypothetical protein
MKAQEGWRRKYEMPLPPSSAGLSKLVPPTIMVFDIPITTLILTLNS